MKNTKNISVTPMEAKILGATLRGENPTEITRNLQISDETLRVHRYNLRKKFASAGAEPPLEKGVVPRAGLSMIQERVLRMHEEGNSVERIAQRLHIGRITTKAALRGALEKLNRPLPEYLKPQK